MAQQQGHTITVRTSPRGTDLTISRLAWAPGVGNLGGFVNHFVLKNIQAPTGPHSAFFRFDNGSVSLDPDLMNTYRFHLLLNNPDTRILHYISNQDALSIIEELRKAPFLEKALALKSTRLTTRRLPSNVAALTASYLTGLEGSERAQGLQLREEMTRPQGGPGVGGKSRKTRRRK